MDQELNPTQRELEILKILWERGEATVREVYEQMSQDLPIVQNTVQAFLRTMEDKGLARHRLVGRTFVYAPIPARAHTEQKLVSRLLQRVFDGAIDQLVDSALALRPPTSAELERLEALVAEARSSVESSGRKRPKKPD